MQPKSKEAAAKLKASEKMQKEAAFAQAIMTDADVPLAEEINPDEICEVFGAPFERTFCVGEGGRWRGRDHALDNRFQVNRQSIGSYSNRIPTVARDRYR